MQTYSKWEDVPAHLKTQTAIKQAGMRRRPKQGVIATIDTRWGSHGGVYNLYDIRECRPQPILPDDEKQRRAERLRQAQINTHCNVCEAYVTKAAKVANGGLCESCMQWKTRRMQRKQEMRDMAHTLLKGCLILDTETTGLTAFDAILELAIINQDGDTLFDSLLQPEFPAYLPEIPNEWPDATAVNGITPEMVVNAPKLSDSKAKIVEMIGDQPVVIYNADFDTAFLQRAGITLTNPVCLMKGFAKYYGEWSSYYKDYKWQSLDIACAIMEIDRATRHRALADTQDALKLLRAIAEREPVVEKFEMYH